MLEEFILYWTEPNKSHTRIKWEMEETWHMGRRLVRWANSNYKNNMPSSQKFKQNGELDEEITKRHKNLMQQSKQFTRYMEDALEDAAPQAEVNEILEEAKKQIKQRKRFKENG